MYIGWSLVPIATDLSLFWFLWRIYHADTRKLVLQLVSLCLCTHVTKICNLLMCHPEKSIKMCHWDVSCGSLRKFLVVSWKHRMQVQSKQPGGNLGNFHGKIASTCYSYIAFIRHNLRPTFDLPLVCIMQRIIYNICFLRTETPKAINETEKAALLDVPYVVELATVSKGWPKLSVYKKCSLGLTCCAWYLLSCSAGRTSPNA